MEYGNLLNMRTITCKKFLKRTEETYVEKGVIFQLPAGKYRTEIF